MFPRRALRGIISSASSSSALRLFPSTTSSSLRCFSKFSSVLSSSSLFSSAASTSSSLSSSSDSSSVSVSPSTEENSPVTLTAKEYESFLDEIKQFKEILPSFQSEQSFLEPNRSDPTVNDSILELYTLAFEQNWTAEKREQTTNELFEEWKKGGDAALVIAINKLVENRVTLRSIVKSLGGWYPLLGLATVAAVSKEIILVNEELLLVTNFLAVFGGIYFAASDTVLESFQNYRNDIIKKYQVQRQLEIDANKALLDAYDKNPKLIALLEHLKKQLLSISKSRSRAVFIKKRAEIQRFYQKKLDAIVIAENRAEGEVRKQLLERFSDYLTFMLNYRKIRPDDFFQDGFMSALTQFITSTPVPSNGTPIGKLVRSYLENELWKVDWKRVNFGPSALRYFGIHNQVTIAQTINRLNRLQKLDFQKYKKEHPNATEKDYYAALGIKGPKSIAQFLREELKNHPEKFKQAYENLKKEDKQFGEEWRKKFQQNLLNGTLPADQSASQQSQQSQKAKKEPTPLPAFFTDQKRADQYESFVKQLDEKVKTLDFANVKLKPRVQPAKEAAKPKAH